MAKKLEEPISLDEELEKQGTVFLMDLYKVSQKVQRKKNTPPVEDKKVEKLLPNYTPPPTLEANRLPPTNDGRVFIEFTSKLIVPDDLSERINKQNKRKRVLKG